MAFFVDAAVVIATGLKLVTSASIGSPKLAGQRHLFADKAELMCRLLVGKCRTGHCRMQTAEYKHIPDRYWIASGACGYWSR